MKRAAVILACILFVFSLTACSGGKASSSNSQASSDIELIFPATDGRIYDKLTDIETDSTIIIEGVIKKNLGQNVETFYNATYKKNIPTSGFTNWEVEVTKVHKGSVTVGDKITFAQYYFIRSKNDGSNQQICSTSQKPAELNQKYLLFLIYNKNTKVYDAVGDYTGKYVCPPSEELKAKGLAGTVTQKDLDIYENETYPDIQSIYKDVIKKYFK